MVDSPYGPEFERRAAAEVSRTLVEVGMAEELTLHEYGYEPVQVWGIGELWKSPGCGCLRDRAHALVEIRYRVQQGRGIAYPEEWLEPPSDPPDDRPNNGGVGGGAG